MTTSARIADILLTQKGYPGLYDWAMDQRRSVRPATWDEVALSLRAAADEKINVRGQMLRRWGEAAEQARESDEGSAQ